MSIVEKPVQKSGTYDRLGKKLMPIFYRAVAGDNDRALLVPLADDLVENNQKLIWKCLQPPIIEDEQIGFEKLLHLL